MLHSLVCILLLYVMHFPLSLHAFEDPKNFRAKVKSSVYLSPPFILQPGSVVNRYYFDIPFPKGHISTKSFHSEVVDETGTPIPLYETYIHHWTATPYYGLKGVTVPGELSPGEEFDHSKIIVKKNDGICKDFIGDYFGFGSETRKTSFWLPGVYGIEVGKPEDVPEGYEERWILNVHVIDTRGTKDQMGCVECRCSLYNVTTDEVGHPLAAKDYIGGFRCCLDRTQCLLREGFSGATRKLYMRYTVSWVDWDDSFVPVKNYKFDVTDLREISNASTDENLPICQDEYEVKPCTLKGNDIGECIDVKKTKVRIPHGGDIVLAVAHQHIGGLGAAIYGQDGRLLCTSTPSYGEGKEAGNEAGYVVGMSTCYPEPGSARVTDGELLTLISNYNNSQHHTGVMGHFNLFVAEPQEKQSIPFTWGKVLPKHSLMFAPVLGLAAVITGVYYSRKHEDDGYRSLIIV